MAALTTAVMQAPINTLEKAIDANSATQFAEAYGRLTEACNADAAMFPDQEFLPSKR
jgi:hypothetical protein